MKTGATEKGGGIADLPRPTGAAGTRLEVVDHPAGLGGSVGRHEASAQNAKSFWVGGGAKIDNRRERRELRGSMNLSKTCLQEKIRRGQ